MCGACSRESPRDWLAPAVPDRAAREMAAHAVTELVVAARLRVRASVSGFTVHRPTGKVTVAPTLTAVWEEVTSAGVDDLDPTSPIMTAGDHPPRLLHGPATQLGLLVASSPHRAVRAWAPDRILRIGEESLDDLLSSASYARVLAWTSEDASTALAAVTSPQVRLRATLVAASRDGVGPPWASNLSGLGDDAIRAVLSGGTPGTIDRPELSAARAAAWAAGVLATGGTAGRRLTLRVARGDVVIDVADGTGLAVRPA